jgi:hypothetical protein
MDLTGARQTSTMDLAGIDRFAMETGWKQVAAKILAVEKSASRGCVEYFKMVFF